MADTLYEGVVVALSNSRRRKSGIKTRYNHIMEANRFVKELRGLGFGVKQWKNLSNKHVQAVVRVWVDRKLEINTIKGYLAAVRIVARFFGNDRIAPRNSEFGIGRRTYISNKDKSLPQDAYDRVVKQLKKGEKDGDTRIAAMFMLERSLGLRTEEAAKFNPKQAVLSDGRVFVCHGTKGGRERTLDNITPEGIEAINYTKKVIKGARNLIPKDPDMTERKWIKRYYNRIRQLGVSKSQCGASGHGNRHAYAQECYFQITMFPCPCKFPSVKEFIVYAEEVVGKDWKERDESARMILKSLLGHGPDRDGVVSQYIGSSSLRSFHE